MKQNSIVTFWHALGDFQSKSLQIWHIWTFEYVPRCEWCVLLTVKYLYFWQTFKFWLISNINVMREACLYNRWCFCSNIFENLQGISEMNPLFFWGGGGGGGGRRGGGGVVGGGDDESPRWGHSPRMRSGGSGDEGSPPNSFDVSLYYSLKHIYTFLRGGGGHSTFHVGSLIFYIYIFCFHDDVIKWKYVPRHWLLCGEFPDDCGEFTGDWWIPLAQTVTRSFDVFFDLRLNKRLSKQSRHRWFETPSRSLWRHCNVVPNSDPMVRAATGSFGVQRVTLVQFLIGETGQIGGFRALWKEWPQIWHTALPWLSFLKINYILHSAAV